MSSPTETIDSIVHGANSVLSFRRLSFLLEVPFHTAQKHLADYVSSRGERSVTVLWQVLEKAETGYTRTSLTTAPPTSTALKHIWAIAPPNTPNTPVVWLQSDRQWRLDHATAPFHEPNALRIGRFLSVFSPTAAWDTRPDPRTRDLGPSYTPHAPRKASNLLNNVKQAARKPTQPAFKSTPMGTASKNSLFSFKRLGQDSADRIKAKQNPSTSTINPPKGSSKASNGSSRGLHHGGERKEAKKARRIVSDDEEDDAVGNSKLEDSEENIDDDTDSIGAMEQKALERERTEEEQAEIERELRDLTGEDEDEPESPVLRDVDDGEVVREDVGTDDKGLVKEPVKRSFRETFGLPNEERGGRRIRKELELMEEDSNGYLVTRRIVKTFDEHGNEIDSDEPLKNEVALENDQGVSASCLPTKSLKSMKSLSKLPSQKTQSKEKSSIGISNTKEPKKNGKSTSSKPSNAIRKKSKKITVDIKSYFGKK